MIYAENRNYVASEREWIKTFNHYTDVWAYGAIHSNEASEWVREREEKEQSDTQIRFGWWIHQTNFHEFEEKQPGGVWGEREKIMF